MNLGDEDKTKNHTTPEIGKIIHSVSQFKHCTKTKNTIETYTMNTKAPDTKVVASGFSWASITTGQPIKATMRDPTRVYAMYLYGRRKKIRRRMGTIH
jgi:hypothetical protein